MCFQNGQRVMAVTKHGAIKQPQVCVQVTAAAPHLVLRASLASCLSPSVEHLSPLHHLYECRGGEEKRTCASSDGGSVRTVGVERAVMLDKAGRGGGVGGGVTEGGDAPVVVLLGGNERR